MHTIQEHIAADCVIPGTEDDVAVDAATAAAAVDGEVGESTLVAAGSVADLCRNTVDFLLRIKVVAMNDITFVSAIASEDGTDSAAVAATDKSSKSGSSGGTTAKRATVDAHKALLNAAWLAVLRMPLPLDVYRVCMVK